MTDRMTQIKFTIDSSIAAAFKAKCIVDGVIMTSVISQWLRTLQPTKYVEPKPLTRPTAFHHAAKEHVDRRRIVTYNVHDLIGERRAFRGC